MSNNINTILIIGATSGLGEQFARRFHALGKKVIITGRRDNRLRFLQSDLGSKTVICQWDITEFSSLTSRATQVLTEHPDINAVFLMAGVGHVLNFLDQVSSAESDILAECNTNVTAQMLLTRIFVPHLASVAATGAPATLLLMGSGLGFVPVSFSPVYCATKAAIHSLALTVRQQVNKAEDQNVKRYLSVVEVVAPFVDTDFAAAFKSPSGPQPMSVEDYMVQTMATLEVVGEDGKPVKEAAVGTASDRVALWRESIGKHMEKIGLVC